MSKKSLLECIQATTVDLTKVNEVKKDEALNAESFEDYTLLTLDVSGNMVAINKSSDLNELLSKADKLMDAGLAVDIKDKFGNSYDFDEDVFDDEHGDFTETAARNDDIHEAHKEAKEYLNDKGAHAVIYGYHKNGKFYKLPKLIDCRDDKELKIASNGVRNQYKANGSIDTVYKSESVESDLMTEELHTLSDVISMIGDDEELMAQFNPHFDTIKKYFNKDADEIVTLSDAIDSEYFTVSDTDKKLRDKCSKGKFLRYPEFKKDKNNYLRIIVVDGDEVIEERDYGLRNYYMPRDTYDKLIKE